ADQRDHLALAKAERDPVDRADLLLRHAPEPAEQSTANRILREQIADLEQRRTTPDLGGGRDSRRARLLTRRQFAHAPAPTGRSFRWQAATCIVSTGFSSGCSTAHRSKARSQRGRKGQPTSSRSSRGGAPGIDRTASSPYR